MQYFWKGASQKERIQSEEKISKRANFSLLRYLIVLHTHIFKQCAELSSMYNIEILRREHLFGTQWEGAVLQWQLFEVVHQSHSAPNIGKKHNNKYEYRWLHNR